MDTQTLLLIALLLGLLVGSFLNVVIYRFPIMLNESYKREALEFLGQRAPATTVQSFNLLWPRSHCPNCGKTLAFWQNVPLLSFAMLRGKCSKCSKQISWRYPLVEILSAALTTLMAWKFGLTWPALIATIFAWGLITLTFIDFAEQILPDEITLGLLWIALISNVFGLFAPISAAIFGAVAGYISLWIIATLFRLIRHKEGLGHGDFKLFAAFGALLGWQYLPMLLLIAAIFGSIVGISYILITRGKFDKPLPFGPYLAIAGIVVMLYGTQILTLFNSFG